MSREVLFRGGPVCAADGVLSDGWVLVRDGHIVDLGSGGAPLGADGPSQIIDLEGRVLAPGLIDLHAHGALGCDTMDADPASLRTMAGYYAQHGVTGYLAATMTAPIEAIRAALKTVAGVMAKATGGARLLGAHLEGPFLDPAHAGAQAPAHVTRADEADYAALFDTGAVRILTLAPEFPESRPLIGYARQRDVVVAMGHTGADYETACEAARLGVSHVTHLYNAMPPLNHRQPGTVGAALTLDALTCELIVDLVHVHPAVVALTHRLLGSERLVLVTDAMSGTGMPDGEYSLGGLPVTVVGGVARGDGGVLAGSTLTMDRAVANMMRATGEPLRAVLPMASRTPARILGLPKGEIAAGRDADLIVLSEDGSVDLTMVSGETVWRR
ncbi:MAG: N-acetylglucosamine-6-phosphate deacetylase [Anaerolineae bacterium]